MTRMSCIFGRMHQASEKKDIEHKIKKRLHINISIYLSTVSPLPPHKPKVFLIGESGLESELRHAGIPFVCGTDPSYNLPPRDGKYEYDGSIGAVLCGFDGAISYPKLARAFVQLRPSNEVREIKEDEECRFLITNADPTYPAARGQDLPGAGSLSAPLRYALGKEREPVVLGKPSRWMWDCIQAKHHLEVKRTGFVGDRLDTDIIFGRENGLGTLLVLSGELAFVLGG